MKTYKPNEIKNIALVGASGSGKTTLAEAMLFKGGIIPRRGSVSAKNSSSDYRVIEQEYGFSVFPTPMYTEWKGNKINFIDAPGADDFVGGVVTAFNVADTAVMVVNAVRGVEVGTEINGRNARKMNKPMMFVLSQLDKENANYDHCLEQLKASFGTKVVPIQYAINPGLGFNQVIDVLKMVMLEWKPEGGAPVEKPIPADEKDKADELNAALCEAAAECDEELMEVFFDKGVLTTEQIHAGILKGIANRDIFPLFCTAAEKDMGIDLFLDFVGDAVPTVSHITPMTTVDGTAVPCDENGAPSIYIFATSIEQHLGEVVYFKVASGVIHEGDDLYNVNTDTKERLTQIMAPAGKNRTKVSELAAGDIGATVKLKNSGNFHTLNGKDADFKFPKIVYPNPRFRTAVKAVSNSDDEKLSEALNKIQKEDPTCTIEYSKELKQMILSGQGEFHLNTVKWRIENLEKIEIEYFAPKIPYRETITKFAHADYRHKKQSGGAGQFGEVHLTVEPYVEGSPDPTMYKINGVDTKISVKDKTEVPLAWGGKLVFCNCIVGGVIDARFMPAILKGIMEKMEEGPLTGSYARDIRICVYFGKMHPVDSNEISFKLAGRNAFSAAFKLAAPKILEPIYDVEVLTPPEFMGDIMSDLNGRRSVIMGMEAEAGFQKLNAKVPLKEMQRYSTALSSITGGRASFSMSFAGYERVSNEIQEELLKAYHEEDKDE